MDISQCPNFEILSLLYQISFIQTTFVGEYLNQKTAIEIRIKSQLIKMLFSSKVTDLAYLKHFINQKHSYQVKDRIYFIVNLYFKMFDLCVSFYQLIVGFNCFIRTNPLPFIIHQSLKFPFSDIQKSYNNTIHVGLKK